MKYIFWRICSYVINNLQSILPLVTFKFQRQCQSKRDALPWLAFDLDICPETSGQNEGSCQAKTVAVALNVNVTCVQPRTGSAIAFRSTPQIPAQVRLGQLGKDPSPALSIDAASIHSFGSQQV